VTGALARLLTVVAPESVRTWYPAFAAVDDPVMFVGERPDDARVVAEAILRTGSFEVRLLSSHDSLCRDLAVARHLTAAGLTVRAQTPLAVRVATDKVFAREVLEGLGVGQPRWGMEAPVGRLERVLRKRRNSTQSKGIGWVTNATSWSRDVYWEEYLDGVEYSIVLYREEDEVTVLPCVWKGRTRRDLLPPWRRLRLCPPPRGDRVNLDQLAALGRVVARASDIWGFAEVEFVVDDEGRPFVLDVNPRICGTMRISAMAASTPIFDARRFPARIRDWPAVSFAGEIPHHGPPLLRPNTIATSRITCRGSSPREVRDMLEASGDAAAGGQLGWPDAW
jgi:hypothetical protein